MSIGEWVLFSIGIITIIVVVVIIIIECMKNKKLTQAIAEDEESFVCYEKVKICKKVVGCYTEGLYMPKSIIQYGCYFLLETGENKLFLVPEIVFHRLKENTIGNLYIKNNEYFDFEEID